MKKICAVFVLSLVLSALFAVDIGVRAGMTINAGSTWAGTFADAAKNGQDKLKVGGGAAAWLHIPVINGFCIQPEICYTANNSKEMLVSEVETIAAFDTIDIPVLLGYKLDIPAVSFYFYGGPYLTLPASKLLVKSSATGTGEYAIDSEIMAGATAGTSLAVKVSGGSIVFDVRYLLDFLPARVKVRGDVFTRRAFNLSVGYQYKL